MRPLSLFASSLLLALSAPALGQSVANRADPVAPNLASPPVDEDQRPSAFLTAAQEALAAGRLGEAQQALEMAQTRLLDRSVPIGQTNVPSDNPAVSQTSEALRALAAHDRSTCMQLIGAAVASASAQGL